MKKFVIVLSLWPQMTFASYKIKTSYVEANKQLSIEAYNIEEQKIATQFEPFILANFLAYYKTNQLNFDTLKQEQIKKMIYKVSWEVTVSLIQDQIFEGRSIPKTPIIFNNRMNIPVLKKLKYDLQEAFAQVFEQDSYFKQSEKLQINTGIAFKKIKKGLSGVNFTQNIKALWQENELTYFGIAQKIFLLTSAEVWNYMATNKEWMIDTDSTP